MPTLDHESAVTVLGLGPMGRALARAFLDAGLRVTVWNRTPGRDGELLGRGATAATSPAEAVAASPLTVVCVVNYDAADTVLHQAPVTDALKGRTVVNLCADTPSRARDAAAWAAAHGIRYLDGAIMSMTTTIGTPEAEVIYSGPEDLYREHQPVLETLGGTHTHLGEDFGRAAAYDIALLDIFWTAMSGYAHALAVARAEGITARELLPHAQGIGAIMSPLFEEFARDADDGTYSGELNPITSGASSMAHIIETSESHGIDAGVMRAAEGQVRRVIGLGHGTDGITRVTEVLGRTRR